MNITLFDMFKMFIIIQPPLIPPLFNLKVKDTKN